ncbi:helix-turn-helix domain-containing protein [Brevundimonas sp. SL130]|uniref:helix-turn-helix domain-containing protein n=1 Tax=Brevundimonas sp. SL130 TaxID=2995143 RepID=UPI00226CCED8|nr:helix-turn-helix transcriptional regulator [Brevundimonas sp. SL130]WAC61323.1 helix-turn-helix transcriptional regulator [Brevundimonas sp. SL130]
MPRSSTTSSTLDVLIGAAIRAHRNDLGWSQADLAARIGVTYQQVQKYETGANRVAATTLASIAASLGCAISALLPEDDDALPATDLMHQIRMAAAALPEDKQQLLLDVAKAFLRGARPEGTSPASRHAGTNAPDAR